jgi:hypothetical protein
MAEEESKSASDGIPLPCFWQIWAIDPLGELRWIGSTTAAIIVQAIVDGRLMDNRDETLVAFCSFNTAGKGSASKIGAES